MPDSSVASIVKSEVMGAGDRTFTQHDFSDLPRSAVSHALSRLAQSGILKRVSRGVYYRSRETVFGQSIAGQWLIEQTVLDPSSRPTGISAAAFLGFTTQQPARSHYAISKHDPTTRLKGVKLTVLRPRHELSREEGALLEFVRDRGKWSELSDEETITKTLKLFRDKDRFDRLARAAMAEPPRVRAIIGAIGEKIGGRKKTLAMLKRSINLTSRYDFGKFAKLPTAKEWGGK